MRQFLKYSRLSLFRLRLSGITAYLEEKIWSFFKHGNLTSGNKILWIRGEIALLPFSTIFSVYIFNLRSQITYLFVKFGCSICIFLSSANLICRRTDISECLRWSFDFEITRQTVLGIADNFKIKIFGSVGNICNFCGVNRCVNAGESLINFTQSHLSFMLFNEL